MKSILTAFMTLAIAILGLPTQGLTTLYTTTLDGASEFPANASPGTGFVTVDLDTILHTLDIQVEFSELEEITTAAHIHGSTASPGTGIAGVITQVPFFEGFPIGVTSGTYSHTFDTTLDATWNPSFITSVGSALSAEAALDSYLAAGTAYFNIHTTKYPGGEIRGFFAAVPEPVTSLLFGIGLVGLAGGEIRRRRCLR